MRWKAALFIGALFANVLLAGVFVLDVWIFVTFPSLPRSWETLGRLTQLQLEVARFLFL